MLIKVIVDSFHIVSAHAPNCFVPRYLRAITFEGATYTLHNVIWEKVKRRINSQIKIRLLVKINYKYNQ